MNHKMDINGKFVDVLTNNIKLRCFESGDTGAPLIILVHGWPESWYSWRHQIDALNKLGFRVVAPDVRGYGGSQKPPQIGDYSMSKLIQDTIGIIDFYEREQTILVGHDWGAPIVWNTAAIHPNRVRAVVGLSVPYSPRGKVSSIDLWKSIYKDRFFYQLYFQKPGKAEKELEKNIRLSLQKIYYSGSGDAPKDIFSTKKTPQADMLSDLPLPEKLPKWLTESDLDYFASQFQHGFGPSLNRYRCQTKDWEELKQLTKAKITVPSCFIAGEKDSVLKFVPDVDLVDHMKPWMTDLRICKIIENIGHWVQQENPKAVNSLIEEFVTSL